MKREEILRLNERQQELITQARANLEKEGRTSEDESAYEAIMAEHDTLDARIDREISLGEAEDRAQERIDAINRGEPDPDDPNDDPDDNTNRRTVGDPDRRPDNIERSLARQRGELVPLNREERFFLCTLVGPRVRDTLLQSDEQRSEFQTWRRAALSSEDNATGGFLVPEGFMPELVRQMLAYGPMGDRGIVREIVTASGNPLPWPIVNDTARKGERVNQNVAVGDADLPAFAQVIFNAYKFTTEALRIPTELIEDSFFAETGLFELLASLLGERMGRIRNETLTIGDGVDDPTGIVTATTKAISTASNVAPTADEMIDIEHSIDPAYRQLGMLRWMFNDNTLQLLRKIKDGEGNYLWNPKDIRAGEPALISGHPYSINQAMDSFGADDKWPIVFGNLMKYVCRKVRGYRLKFLVERYAEFDQVAYIGWQRLDGNCIDTRAIKKVKSSA